MIHPLFLYSITSALIFLIFLSILGLIAWKKDQAILYKQNRQITLLRMQNIRNRLSPHFFFNVLNSFAGETQGAAVIHQNLKKLMLLLRQSVDNTEQLAIHLEEELGLVEAYLEMQGWRIPHSFHFQITVDSKTDLKLLVPAMIIQIPVENAIRHGLLPLQGEKRLTVQIASDSQGTQITIEDNGIGLMQSGNRASGAGTGLKLLFQTIDLFNSENIHPIKTVIRDLEPALERRSGTRITFHVPAHYSYQLADEILIS